MELVIKLFQYILCDNVPSLIIGLHRYVFLVYKQPSKLNYDEELRISKKYFNLSI